MNTKRQHIIQFVCIMAILIAIAWQGLAHVVKTKPLNGAITNARPVEFNFQTYLDGSYQDWLTEHAKLNTGFREFFIRNYNQVVFSCFNKITNDNVVMGFNKELFLKMYLEEITGKRLLQFYPSVEAAKADARNNVEATLKLIDTLQQHGTSFLFVFAPSKTSTYPEYMPLTYQEHVSDFSLEEYYIQLFKEAGIPFIDFHNYFKSIKDDYPYPLYTRTGTHWSEATMPMVADSLLRKLEEVSGCRFPRIKLDDLNFSADYSAQDGELEGQLNLLFPLQKPALPQPLFTLQDTVGKDRPRILVIADSYFVQLSHSCFVDAFSRWDYWKYNREVVSSDNRINFKEVQWLPEAPRILEDADIVLAMFTAPCFYSYMYGFANSALELYEQNSNDNERNIQLIIKEISSNPDWTRAVERQAKELGLSFEENLVRNAIYVNKVRNEQAKEQKQ